ncbi:MAG TPA: hypothetical protein VLQ48_04760 [Chloroflexia bacterium]|nr:hypothetical protein [Chloroflexia bacterium]
MDQYRQLVNVVGPERVLLVGGSVSAIAVLVLIVGWALIGFWAGLLAAILVLAGFFIALQRVLAQVTKTGGPRLATMPSAQALRIDMSKLSGRQRDYMQRALDRKASIDRAVAAAGDPGMRRALGEATADLPELVQTVYELALKSQGVQMALQSSGTMPQLIQDTQRLDSMIKSTSDEFQKSQYRSTLDGKLQQMQNLTDTEVALKRWDAQMENALGTLDTILSQVLRASSSQVLSYGSGPDDLSSTLRRQVDDLKATSDAFDSVYGANK